VNIHTNAGVTEIGSCTVKLDNGKILDADMVLLSIGVRPTLQLAADAGLEIGEAGGLLVNAQLQTSDPDIFAAGDMVEIEHRVNGKKVRIPLAGPANRQGRIAAENALGGKHAYKGSIGTSVVRVFEAVAGISGLSLKQACSLGLDADAVVVHKEHHTSYYPGAENVTVQLVYDRNTGVVLGGQTAGYKGADKRLDVIATAVASKLTVSDLADIDFAYSPPIGTANDAMNMAAYTAENRISGFSPSVSVSELDALIEGKNPVFLDVRDIFAFEKSHVKGAIHLPLEILPEQLSAIPQNRLIVVYDETGKKGHQALRTLIGAGFTQVVNISGGHISLQRQARTVGFKQLQINLLPVENKTIEAKESQEEEKSTSKSKDVTSTLIVDVRSPEEFYMGAVPDAINIPLDELMYRAEELGNNAAREIIVYCASGARSAYAQQMLMQYGYTNVKNGGGVSQMMARARAAKSSPTATAPSNDPIVIDVRSPQEFRSGAVPGAVNIPLDDLQRRVSELGSKSRNITLYCASGSRSAYAQRMLQQMGFTNTKNGGGIMQMMRSR